MAQRKIEPDAINDCPLCQRLGTISGRQLVDYQQKMEWATGRVLEAEERARRSRHSTIRNVFLTVVTGAVLSVLTVFVFAPLVQTYDKNQQQEYQTVIQRTQVEKAQADAKKEKARQEELTRIRNHGACLAQTGVDQCICLENLGWFARDPIDACYRREALRAHPHAPTPESPSGP